MTCQRCNATPINFWYPTEAEPTPPGPTSRVVTECRFKCGPVSVLCLECANAIDAKLSASPEWEAFLYADANLKKNPTPDAARDVQKSARAVRELTISMLLPINPESP